MQMRRFREGHSSRTRAWTSIWVLGLLAVLVVLAIRSPLMAERQVPAEAAQQLSLITDTPDEGFELALVLARRGVTSTQPDREVLQSLRPEYSTDADALIASSHVVAVHFRTIAEANDFWR